MKSIWQSRTFWLNIASAIVELAQMLSGINIIPSGYLLITVNVLNIIIRRFLTSEPIGNSSELQSKNQIPKQ